MKPFKCSFLGNDLIPENAANIAVWQGRPEPKLSLKCFLWMFLSWAGSLCLRVLRFSWALSVKAAVKEKEGGKGPSLVLRNTKAGLFPWRKGRCGGGGRQPHCIRPPKPSFPSSI